MASNKQQRRPLSVSTLNMDIDDIEPSPRVNSRRAYQFEETALVDSNAKKNRWCLITLILILIIVGLLALAGLIIAIYALVLAINISRASTTLITTSSTTIANVTTTTTAIVCTPTPTTFFQYSTATPTQCLNYTTNTDATRNLAYTASINLCDNVSPFNNTTSTWIRFQDPAGKQVVNSPVPPNYCGTVVTGWYAGQYPTAIFSTATSLACFYQIANTCASCNWISVTNCQTYYVFLLPEPQSCNYRYCTI